MICDNYVKTTFIHVRRYTIKHCARMDLNVNENNVHRKQSEKYVSQKNRMSSGSKGNKLEG